MNSDLYYFCQEFHRYNRVVYYTLKPWLFPSNDDIEGLYRLSSIHTSTLPVTMIKSRVESLLVPKELRELASVYTQTGTPGLFFVFWSRVDADQARRIREDLAWARVTGYKRQQKLAEADAKTSMKNDTASCRLA